MLETLDHTIRIGSTPTFLYFDSYLFTLNGARRKPAKSQPISLKNDARATYGKLPIEHFYTGLTSFKEAKSASYHKCKLKWRLQTFCFN